jgi:nitrate reductase NapAB chaperone NapD
VSRIAGVVVRTLPDAHGEVGSALRALPEVEIAATAEHGYSVVLTASDARRQEALHSAIREWPGVLEVAVAFQSADIEEQIEAETAGRAEVSA